MTIPCLYWPLTVAASEMVLRLTRTPNATGIAVTTNTAVTAGTYLFPGGTGSLAKQIGNGGTTDDFGTVNGVTVTITVSAAGVCSIAVGGLQVSSSASIPWATNAATAALAVALGFDPTTTSTATESGGIATLTGTENPSHFWTPDLPPRNDEPIADREVVVGRSQGGQNTFDKITQFDGRRIDFQWLAAGKVKTASETRDYAALQRLLDDDEGPGKFRWWNDRASLSTGYADYFLDETSLTEFRPDRLNEASALYSVALALWEYQS